MGINNLTIKARGEYKTYSLQNGLHGAHPKPCSFTNSPRLGASKLIRELMERFVRQSPLPPFPFGCVNGWVNNLHASVNGDITGREEYQSR
jgi:hypothetical protein